MKNQELTINNVLSFSEMFAICAKNQTLSEDTLMNGQSR